MGHPYNRRKGTGHGHIGAGDGFLNLHITDCHKLFLAQCPWSITLSHGEFEVCEILLVSVPFLESHTAGFLHNLFQLRSVRIDSLFKHILIPLGFIRKAWIIHLRFIIINVLFPLGFIKQIYLFPLGFVRKYNNSLCISIKMSTFAPIITNNKNVCI